MIIVSNRIPVNPAYTDEFEARFAEREGLVDGMDGFISFQILRPQNPDDPYVVMTYWESMAHFEAWKESEQFKAQHGNRRTLPDDALLGRPKIEVHDIIQRKATATEATS